MTSPGILRALAREHETETARRAARPRPMRTPDASRADRVRDLLAVASGNRRRERRAAIRVTVWETERP
jgi:hypothetical protein